MPVTITPAVRAVPCTAPLAAFGPCKTQERREAPLDELVGKWERYAGTPCSFCHATGFVGTNVCQECRGLGSLLVELASVTLAQSLAVTYLSHQL